MKGKKWKQIARLDLWDIEIRLKICYK